MLALVTLLLERIGGTLHWMETRTLENSFAAMCRLSRFIF